MYWIAFASFLIFLQCISPVLTSIDCYDCHSINGTDPHCEDPIAPAYQKLKRRCMVPKEKHIGTFPANFCIKMIGTSLFNRKTLVVRTCVLEDMNSQCGTFKFQNDTLKGCLLTCDYDGCNRGAILIEQVTLISLALVLLLKTWPRAIFTGRRSTRHLTKDK